MWKKVKNAVTSVANTVANVVSTVVSKASDAVADVVTTAGNAFADGLTGLGTKLPFGGKALKWFGGVVSGLTTSAASLIKGVGSIVGGLLSGLLKIAAGIVTLSGPEVLEGLGNIASGFVGAAIVLAGAGLAFTQQVFGIGQPRPLTAHERDLIKLVFRSSIATYNVRVVEGKTGLFGLSPRGFTLGDVIYMKHDSAMASPSVFVHECVHVWQSQHVGSRYAAEAVYAQTLGDGYDWEQEASEGRVWDDFQREPQAQMIQEVFVHGGAVRVGAGHGRFFAQDDESLRFFNKRVDWTNLANAATRTIRGAKPWRLSGLIKR